MSCIGRWILYSSAAREAHLNGGIKCTRLGHASTLEPLFPRSSH